MADLNILEKRAFEKLLDMESGYVLEFSNTSFDNFVIDSVNKSIYEEKYNYASGSKANRLRAFWKIEQSHIVGKLMKDLLEYAKLEKGLTCEKCNKTVKRLIQNNQVVEIESISPHNSEKEFTILAESIKASIEKRQPEEALDRLHTYTTKYLRTLCKEKAIDTNQGKPLHSLFGEYIKTLKNEGKIESEITLKIFRANLSIFEDFNKVRNNQSLAHDNKILNYEESLLIFNQITSMIRFLKSIEISHENEKQTNIPEDFIEIPF